MQAGLTETKALGYNFTWRKKGIANNINKIFVNISCLQKFSYMKALALSQLSSDHNPLLLHLTPLTHKKGFPFRYDNHWHTKEGYSECISKGLYANTWKFPSYTFLHKLQACKRELKKWNKERPGDYLCLEEAEDRLSALEQEVDRDPTNEQLYDSMLNSGHEFQ